VAGRAAPPSDFWLTAHNHPATHTHASTHAPIADKEAAGLLGGLELACQRCDHGLNHHLPHCVNSWRAQHDQGGTHAPRSLVAHIQDVPAVIGGVARADGASL
jgi:uncharacterized protein involved in copper resistance